MTDERLANIDNYRMLANAIVQKACTAYVSLWRSNNRKRDNVTELVSIPALERFFRSHEFMLFTNDAIDPEWLIK